MSLVRSVVALVLIASLQLMALGDDKPTVAVKLAKFPELEKIIQAHKGKVVIVDVWSTT
jgi:hypothetical protein